MDIVRGFVRSFKFSFQIGGNRETIALMIGANQSGRYNTSLRTGWIPPPVSPGSFRFAEQLASQPGYETRRLVERR